MPDLSHAIFLWLQDKTHHVSSLQSELCFILDYYTASQISTALWSGGMSDSIKNDGINYKLQLKILRSLLHFLFNQIWLKAKDVQIDCF